MASRIARAIISGVSQDRAAPGSLHWYHPARAMTDQDPAIRAHYAKLALKRLRAYPEGKGAEIRERLGADLLAAVREVASPDWLPANDFVAICEAIHGVLGEDATRVFWTDLMRDSYDHGLLKPLTMLAQQSPGSAAAIRLLAMAPQAWRLSSRACGDIEMIEAAEEDGRSRFRGVDLIPEILHSRGFICVFYGTCKAMLELFKSRGEVRVLDHLPGGAERPQIAFEIVFQRSP